MNTSTRFFKQIAGYLVQVLTLPAVLGLIGYPLLVGTSQMRLFIGGFLTLGGLLGVSLADLLILRFGEGTLRSPQHVVDVGCYARNRHPYFWFATGYHLGLLILSSAPLILVLRLWLALTAGSLLYVLLIQEKMLLATFGAHYEQYRQTTPLFSWKFVIPEPKNIQVLPQLVWLFGQTFLKRWYGITARGLEHLPTSKPFLVVANHESYLDPFLFGIFIPFEIKFATTADVFTTPLMRLLLKGTGTFPMRRHRQDLKSIRTMIRMVNSGQVVGIFPEGGRSLDGSPLPVLKETLKLIQRCKVPILPIHIDGAYEIWPRWAPNRRRGQVDITFHPLIPVAEQTDLAKLAKLVTRTIFSEQKVFRTVHSRSITKGLENFLWACCQCLTHNSIKRVSNTKIGCTACGTSWNVAANYTFSNTVTGETCTPMTWNQKINQSILDHPAQQNAPMELLPDERVYLLGPLDKYISEADDHQVEDLGLMLTDQRLVLLHSSQEVQAWTFDSITILTLDYHNAISIGVGGMRHTFFLPNSDISLRWLAHFNVLVSSCT